MSEHPYAIGWDFGMDHCTLEPGLNLEQRHARAMEAAMFYPLDDRQEFIKGFMAGYAQSQVYKDMPSENRP